ncbi:MAG: N-acyl-L-homoserine lactone synthetase [Rhodobacteraceae bacterium]|nr:N-acyl-L-homoserine lactone synthetase [Paracoccaceae bacterium]MBO29179.1 N-acyl-L-homoserine lactone synthetase [Paracoccaceae bacterium]
MGIQKSIPGIGTWKHIFPDLIPQEELNIAALESKSARASRQRLESANSRTLPPLSEQNRQVRAITLSMTNMHNHGELFVNFMRARREVFIQSKGWDLPEVDGMEFDQYDTPRARWIVLHEYGEVLGGVRLTPTTSQCGQYSYMIRDAQQGLIDTIPRDVLFFKAPVNPTVWEATRLFLAPSIPSQRRMELQRLLLARMATAAAEMNASHVIGIVPAVFSRWMTRLGVMSAVPVGPVLNIDGDRTQAALMRAVPDEQVN